MAGVWKLPVIFVIENNGYGLSTPVEEQYACSNLVDRAGGYGLEGMLIDGNNYFEVATSIKKARQLALKGNPVFIEAKTFRMRGHEEASGTFYVEDEEFEKWMPRDPVLQFENWLSEAGFINEYAEIDKIKNDIGKTFEPHLRKALQAENPVFDESAERKRAGLKPSEKPLATMVYPHPIHRKNVRLMRFTWPTDRRSIKMKRTFSLDRMLLSTEVYLKSQKDFTNGTARNGSVILRSLNQEPLAPLSGLPWRASNLLLKCSLLILSHVVSIRLLTIFRKEVTAGCLI